MIAIWSPRSSTRNVIAGRRIGWRCGLPSRTSSRPPYRALEDAAGEHGGVEPHHRVRAAVLDRVEAAVGVAHEHLRAERLDRACLAGREVRDVDRHREAYSRSTYCSSVRWKWRIRTSCTPRCRLRNAAERMPFWMR